MLALRSTARSLTRTGPARCLTAPFSTSSIRSAADFGRGDSGVGRSPGWYGRDESTSRFGQSTYAESGQEMLPRPLFSTHLRLHTLCTRNNTIATLTRADGTTIAVVSSGKLGFKKAAKEGYEAAYQVALKIFELFEKEKKLAGDVKLEVCFNGFGQGRDAIYRAIMAVEGEGIRPHVVRFTDTSPIVVGGCRPKKKRIL